MEEKVFNDLGNLLIFFSVIFPIYTQRFYNRKVNLIEQMNLKTL